TICFAIASIALYAGISIPLPKRSIANRNQLISTIQSLVENLSKVSVVTTALIATCWTLLFIYAYGGHEILTRNIYIPTLNSPGGYAIANFLIPFVGVLLGACRHAISRAIFFLIITLILLATG